MAHAYLFDKWWSRLEEPECKGCLKSFVKSNIFESLCATAIVLNSFFIAYTADWEMRRVGQLGDEDAQWIKTQELCFVIFYIIELVLRISVHRLYFFINEDMKW